MDIKEWFEKRLEKAKKEIALRMEFKAVMRVPVDTGTLKQSIRSGVVGNTIWVGAGFDETVDYAPYVEYGTRYWVGKPFLRPAVFETQAEVPKILAKWLSN